MKYIDEYRDADRARHWAEALSRVAVKPWTIMEVCGGQTHAILKYGIDTLLPPSVELIHGPGCPVCVTPIDMIDRAIDLALGRGVILCSFGDMLRVPGSGRDLLSAKAAGADVRIVYSPLDALKTAEQNPGKEVVFFAVGFETTAPATAMAVYRAAREQIANLSFLVAHVLVPPALEVILESPQNRVQGFLAPGHVCTVMGFEEYEALADRFQVPIVVTGFEPVDILQGVYLCVRQMEEGRAEVENQYIRSVHRRGNEEARRFLAEVFEPASRTWRGIGEIRRSGLRLREIYGGFDAERRFPPETTEFESESQTPCIAGQVLQGIKKPHECPAFGQACTPDHPLGAPMVSSEGACAAYFRYRC
jgi:hydrogenase expression/formation protein HypD